MIEKRVVIFGDTGDEILERITTSFRVYAFAPDFGHLIRICTREPHRVDGIICDLDYWQQRFSFEADALMSHTASCAYPRRIALLVPYVRGQGLLHRVPTDLEKRLPTVCVFPYPRGAGLRGWTLFEMGVWFQGL